MLSETGQAELTKLKAELTVKQPETDSEDFSSLEKRYKKEELDPEITNLKSSKFKTGKRKSMVGING
jgi:hypothetical protein